MTMTKLPEDGGGELWTRLSRTFIPSTSVLRLPRHCDDLHSVISTIAQPYSHLVSF
jgi:hypothetical protein